MNPNLSRAQWLCTAVLGLVLTGCSTPSINAIYSEDESEVVQDDRVVGLWGSDNPKKENDRYRVSVIERTKTTPDTKQNIEPTSVYYKLTLEDDAGNAKKNGEFELRVVRLGATDFIDVYPANAEVRSLGDRYGMAAIPTHIIMPVSIKDDHITVRPLDLGKIKTLLTEAPNMTPHTIRDKEVVILTGSPRQVQEFFRKISGDDQVFDDPLELNRIADTKNSTKPATTEPAKKPARDPVRHIPARKPRP